MEANQRVAVFSSATAAIDQFLGAIPSKEVICQRLTEIEEEKKRLKKLLRIASDSPSHRESMLC